MEHGRNLNNIFQKLGKIFNKTYKRKSGENLRGIDRVLDKSEVYSRNMQYT